MTETNCVFGSYSCRSDVESAIAGFKDAGFSNSEISVILPDTRTSQETDSKEIVTENDTKAPQAATVGVGSGAALGGALGWLVGIGAFAIPGVGPVIALGPVVACLAGIGIGGALGGFAGSLIGLGISEDQANRYQGRLLKGGIVVAIHCKSRGELQQAREIMEITKAEDIAIPSEIVNEHNRPAA